MSENKNFDSKEHTNDPGNFAQRGEHVNRDPNEPMGGLKNDREPEKNSDENKKGDSTQAGTQNSSSARSESGAGSGNLTEENRAKRTDKFGPDQNSNTSGF